MDNKYLIRQWEILPQEKLGQEINIIGAGAIGSFTALALAKMGFENITTWDDDVVSEENISNQFYRISDIGKPKVLALQEIIKDFTGVTVDVKNEKYISGQLKGIVIMALDSMFARKLVWDNHKEMAIGTSLVIDGRMGAEQVLCYAMNPLDPVDIKSYEKTLYSDENSIHERCTAKSIMYTVLSVSSHIVKVVKDYLYNEYHDYVRVCEWSLKNNQQKCWHKIKK